MEETGTMNSNRIKINHPYSTDNDGIPSSSQIQQFQKDGFTTFPTVFCTETIHALNHELELVLRGTYDTNVAPDKHPKIVKQPLPTAENDYYYSLGYSGNERSKVFQIINIHKSNKLFRELVLSPILGKLVAKLMQWEGARLAQDQIWAKPSGSKPLVYHRDSPYFMFDPDSVATVWIALDDMDEEKGPLTYVKGSHMWGNGRWGSAQYFFMDDGGESLLHSAAERAGIDIDDLEYVSMTGLMAGGLSIHDGRTWHGSGSNMSQGPRRGIGLHFVPVDVKWTTAAIKSSLWRSYVEDVISSDGSVSDIKINDDDFPVTWKANRLDSSEAENNENTEKHLMMDREDGFRGYSPFHKCYQDQLSSGITFKYMPTDSEAVFDDDDSYDETKSHEEVFVVENVPNNYDDDDTDSLTPQNSCHDDRIIDFNLIAEQALASLDADYNDTIQFDDRHSSEFQRQKSQSENDVAEKLYSDETSSGFGSFKANSDASLLIDMPSTFPKINAIAVKSAMTSIPLKSTHNMSTKWRAWKPAHIEYSSFTVPESHEIIPSKQLATFRQHSEKAKKIATSLSKSATIAEALCRVIQNKISLSLFENDVFVVHCIVTGAVEYQSISITERTFGPVIKWLHQYKGCFLPSSIHVKMEIIGPDIPFDLIGKTYEFPGFNNKGRVHAASITYRRSIYLDYLDEIRKPCATPETMKPNMIIAFNPRFRDNATWHQTLIEMFSMQLSAIFVITAYTMHDAENDTKTLKSLVSNSSERCLWSPEVNPFSSRVEYQTKSLGESCFENGVWQAFILMKGHSCTRT